ncbi:MAG: DUF4391 domain-containing protein [Mariprofundaceae bacterium]|nr:DUF4391 domain-containing protein [Mariprofundaceae bacterium]
MSSSFHLHPSAFHPYAFPSAAYFGRMLAKGKIYERATMTSALKAKFVNQIEKIVWQYKLSPETINLLATAAVPEIQVFNILLKGDDIDEILLRTIDQVIPFPIYFQLIKQGKVKVKAAYKHPSGTNKDNWLIEPYLETEWMNLDTDTNPLPIALDLEKLYALMLQSLIPSEIVEQSPQSSIKEQVDRLSQYKITKKAYNRLKAKRDSEKQFNRKVELNAQLKIIKKELE